VSQCDLRETSGLRTVIHLIKSKMLPVPIIEFTISEIVRSGICEMWVRAFEEAHVWSDSSRRIIGVARDCRAKSTKPQGLRSFGRRIPFGAYRATCRTPSIAPASQGVFSTRAVPILQPRTCGAMAITHRSAINGCGSLLGCLSVSRFPLSRHLWR
jgi:hypothetical protein